MKTSPRFRVPAVASLLLVLAVAAPALGHAELTSSDPEDKAVLATPPSVITLAFSEGLDRSKSSFRVEGPAGSVGTGKAGEQGGTVMTLDGLALGTGAYAIAWTAVATDGHVERGKLSFTVAEPTPAPATPSPTPGPAARASASGAAPSADSTAPATSPAAPVESPMASVPGGDPSTVSSSGGTSGTDIAIAVVAGLAIAGAGGLFIVRRSRGA